MSYGVTEWEIDDRSHTGHRARGETHRYTAWEKGFYRSNLDRKVVFIKKRLYDLALEEIACLRSVISEFDCDKSCYTQWIRANDIAEIRLDSTRKSDK